MRLRRLLWFALLLALGTAQATALVGRVLDAVTGEPVPYATVVIPGTEMNAVADSAGGFRLVLQSGAEHVTVVVSRVGYDEKRYEDLDASCGPTLYIRPSPIHLEETTVTAFRTPTPLERSGPVSVVEPDDAAVGGRTSVAELVQGLPSVALKDYGNFATIGLRGANTEQTLVLLDGVRLNSAQDNLFDLTTLPLSSAQRVEVVRGTGSALWGANTIGGLVNVIPPEPDRLGANATAGLGSFGRKHVRVTHTNRSDPLGYVVAASLNLTGDRFSYRDTSDSVHERVNSDIKSQDLMARGVFAQGRHRLSLLGEYNVTRRGEPGPTSWPADSARMEDYRGIAHLSYDWEQADGNRFESRLYSHQSWRHFWNPDTLSWVNDTHATAVFGLTAKQTAHPAGWATVVAGLEGEREEFRSSAIGEPRRLTGSGWTEARLRWSGFDIVPMARFDWLSDSRRRSDSTLTRSNTRVVNPKLSLAYSGPSWLNVHASVGRSFRAPTFNELYWPEDPWTKGNPQLRPEWATSIDLGVSARHQSLLSGRIGLWHSLLTDLIQWLPDSAYVYSPVNLDTATITGVEVEASLSSAHAGIDGTATYMLARSHGMDLIYRPRLGFNLSPWAGWSVTRLVCDVRYTGPRYTTPDTLPPDSLNSLPGYMLLDVGFALSPTLGRVNAAFRAGIRNLLDLPYEVMKGYPVPGRNWYAEAKLSV